MSHRLEIKKHSTQQIKMISEFSSKVAGASSSSSGGLRGKVVMGGHRGP